MSWLFRAAMISACLSMGLDRAESAERAPPTPGYFDPETRTFTALIGSAGDRARVGASPEAGGRLQSIFGKVTLEAVVELVTELPANVRFRAFGVVSGGSRSSLSPKARLGYGEIAGDATVRRDGRRLDVSITLPYAMEIDGSARTLSVSLDVAPDIEGVSNLSFRRSIPIPRGGATAVVSFPGAL